MKPIFGRIIDWQTSPCEGGLGYMIHGTFLDHPSYAGHYGHTSYVVSALSASVRSNHVSTEIETKNSMYSLIGPDVSILRPCPFCGNRPFFFVFGPLMPYPPDPASFDGFQIQCVNRISCGAMITFPTQTEVVEAWQRR